MFKVQSQTYTTEFRATDSGRLKAPDNSKFKLTDYVTRFSLLLCFAAASPFAFAHRHPAYSHDSDIHYSNPKWMALLDENTRVSQLSLPETHDTMSFYGGDAVATQTLRLRKQLNAGVRVFDIRLRAIANKFAIHHGPVYQNAMFGDVLNDMTEFLRANPKETLFVRIKEEYSSEHSSMSFEQIFES
ncbi:phosphatidylinositol-specific phospholipase C domain-containing protein [Burkholderia sp. JSH-S8]|nr:phosphatidylinositol-specific phospholipase C domain-containing protein [Burkholderia sp. JSH-S8]